MAKHLRTYTKEFKQEAVRLVEGSGKSMSQVARDLGISDSTLYNWCQKSSQQGEQAFPGSGHQTALEEENRQLRRELEVTKQERDILKKRSTSSRGASREVPLHCPASARLPCQNHVSSA